MITSFLKISLVLSQGYLALIKFYPSLMISLNLLTQVWNKAFFLISQKLLTKYFTNTLVYGTYIKIKQNGISGNPLNLIIDFVNLRKRVVLNGKFHLWANISAGVPQNVSNFVFFNLLK